MLCLLVSFVVFPLNVYFAAFLFLIYIFLTQNIHRDFINRTDDKPQNKIRNTNVYAFSIVSAIASYILLYVTLGVILEDTKLVISTINFLYRDIAATDLFSISFFEKFDELHTKYNYEYALLYSKNYLVFNFIFAVLFVLFFPFISSAAIAGLKIIRLDQFDEVMAKNIAKMVMFGIFMYFITLTSCFLIAFQQSEPNAFAPFTNDIVGITVSLVEFGAVRIYGIGAFLIVLFPMFLASQKSKYL